MQFYPGAYHSDSSLDVPKSSDQQDVFSFSANHHCVTVRFFYNKYQSLNDNNETKRCDGQNILSVLYLITCILTFWDDSSECNLFFSSSKVVHVLATTPDTYFECEIYPGDQWDQISKTRRECIRDNIDGGDTIFCQHWKCAKLDCPEEIQITWPDRCKACPGWYYDISLWKAF